MASGLTNRPPSLRLWAAEGLEVPGLLVSPLQRPVPIPPGRGQPVLVYPGYLTTDTSSLRLRRSLSAAGYRAHGWQLGRNRGARVDLLDQLGDSLLTIAQSSGQKVALIGWSLGGIYAREVAKRHPEAVSLVMTLGSPFSGDIRANNAWRIYELLNNHKVDRPPLEIDIAAKPPVRTLAVWSPRDGIVPPSAARGEPWESDRQIEVAIRHLSLARQRKGIELIGQLLAEELNPAA
jgi:hypothetical protein